jgi:potassium/hydrogen antiporter
VDQINQTLLIAGLLFFGAVALSAASQRVGVPSLLVFLAVGLFATEIPGAPPVTVSVETAALIGNLALAVILLDGGLHTRFATFRMVAGPGLALATVGVVITASIVGAISMPLLGFDWRYGLLLGAIVGSTDAAAVFALLGGGGAHLNQRVEATLEVESGLNDPAAVFLTVAMIELILSPGNTGWNVGTMLVQQLFVGLAAGWVLGHALAYTVARIRLGEGLYALLIQSGGLLIFALTNLIGGSGFLAIYLAGMVVSNRRRHISEDVLRVSDGFAWLAQAAMFLLLGLVTDVNDLMINLTLQAMLVVLGLMLIARPLAAAACLLPFRYSVREAAFIGWVGMRGAVPIVLGLFPLLAGLPNATLLFYIAFFTTLLSLLLQGGTLSMAARLAGVQRPRGASALSSASLEGGHPPREVIQFSVAPDSFITTSPVAEAKWPAGARLVEVSRNGQPLVTEQLAAGDLVTVVTSGAALSELEHLFGPPLAAGELAIDPDATVGDVLGYYGVDFPEGSDPAMLLTAFVGRCLNGRAASGDVLEVGALALSVRQADDGVVRRVGLRLTRAQR